MLSIGIESGCHNVALSKFLDLTILLPGEIFSPAQLNYWIIKILRHLEMSMKRKHWDFLLPG